MVNQQEEMPTLEEIALWMGELQISLRIAYKKINKLKEEIERLKQELAKNANNKG